MTKNLRILIVDDDKRMVKTLVDILMLKGFQTVGSYSGTEALDLLQKKDFDCVLTDIKMPEMNGIEFFRKIKTIRPSVSVVFMTAYATNELVSQAMEEGAIATLNKPLDINLLLCFLSALREDLSIVIVDDDPMFCKTLGGVLKNRGFNVSEVSEPDSLYAILKPEGQVVLLDMKLNNITGLEVLKKIRKKFPDLPVVLITGYREDMASSIDAALKINAFTCLYKPFQIEELLGVLASIHKKELGRILNETPFSRR